MSNSNSGHDAVENARRVYLVVTRSFKLFKSDRLHLANTNVCRQAGLSAEDIVPAQELLVTAGVFNIRRGGSKSLYAKTGLLRSRLRR